MISKKSEKAILKEMFNSPNIILPQYSFPGLSLKEEDFLSLDEIKKISQKETFNKLLALREISNSIIAENKDIAGISYNETKEPKIKLLVGNVAAKEYNLSEYDENTNQFYYIITESILDYLLLSKNLMSSFDLMLVQDYKKELELIKQTFDNGTFYPDFSVKDYTGIIDISSTHDNYEATHITDSIVIPKDFGKINIYWYYSGLFDYYINYIYKANTQEWLGRHYLGVDEISENRIFVHKKLLPDAYHNKK